MDAKPTAHDTAQRKCERGMSRERKEAPRGQLGTWRSVSKQQLPELSVNMRTHRSFKSNSTKITALPIAHTQPSTPLLDLFHMFVINSSVAHINIILFWLVFTTRFIVCNLFLPQRQKDVSTAYGSRTDQAELTRKISINTS